MFQCHICGGTEARETLVKEIFQIGDKWVLVENIPAKVCSRCGEPVFSRQVTEDIRQMVHGETSPVRSVTVDVFAFA